MKSYENNEELPISQLQEIKFRFLFDELNELDLLLSQVDYSDDGYTENNIPDEETKK